MESIAARYAEIKDAITYENKEDELIAECYKYKIFKDNPSKRFKDEFKEDFEHEYPVYLSDITKKLARRLRGRIKFRKEEEAFEERASQQRAKRGYADVDVWNMDSWFLRTVSPMLKQLRKRHHGFLHRFYLLINHRMKRAMLQMQSGRGF